MGYHARISKSFEDSLILPLTASSRYILMSDCHRGSGDTNDNFLKNEPAYLAALSYYLRNGFTYLELGDGDELWENRSMEQIKSSHHLSFSLLTEYYQRNRLYLLYGNHDMAKRYFRFTKKRCSSYYCTDRQCEIPLFPDIKYHSGIILHDPEHQKKICLTHGHQTEVLNSVLWPLARFLVRYVWKPLENIGVADPTSAAKNNDRKRRSEGRLTSWARREGSILITGHTHRPMTGSKDSPYFNTGSCVHPGGITGIEIRNRSLTLVKWSVSTRSDYSLYVRREVLADVVRMDDL